MKKKLGTVFVLNFCVLTLFFCAAIGLGGCGKEKHTHSFTERKTELQYLASSASCTDAEKYCNPTTFA